ncbi:MAG: hypothetical protein CFE21_08480 [Bacteroidetes bacterium B1(2017)]|nr:MAG: hypothetical protein CFE21_08480 [Bacteroidetes bacterium B1(2017)]
MGRTKRVVCVGSGLAAIYFSLNLSEDIELVLVMAEGAYQSNSYLAKGGIAVSLTFPDHLAHFEDTLRAGAGLCDTKITKEVVFNSDDVLQKLKKRGLLFDPTPSKEGGHSRSRIQHISDQTGKFLLDKLWFDLQKRKNTHFLSSHAALELVEENGECLGVKVANERTGETQLIFADAVVLANGGTGNLYSHNTNGSGANGEGSGIAVKAGLNLEDMEFIQFHPSKLFLPETGANVLVTEAFRGAGAFLQDKNGVDFMRKIHPLGSLAPRDIVSLGMFMKMEEEHLPFVWLNFSKVDPSLFKQQFPYLFKEVSKANYLGKGRVPVSPAAHYQCGGIPVNKNSQTQMPGLFAIGEVARTGLHGANRLASNSLLELFYFGEKLAKQISRNLVSGRAGVETLETLDTEPIQELQVIHENIKELMWHSFGIRRNPLDMANALQTLKGFTTQIENYTPTNLPAQRLANRITAATEIAQAAINRTRSLGCHQLVRV